METTKDKLLKVYETLGAKTHTAKSRLNVFIKKCSDSRRLLAEKGGNSKTGNSNRNLLRGQAPAIKNEENEEEEMDQQANGTSAADGGNRWDDQQSTTR